MTTRLLAHKGPLVFSIGCAVAAAAYLTVGLLRRDTALAIGGSAVVLAYGAGLLLFGRRSEPLALLGANPGDERQRLVMLRALAATGAVLVWTVVLALLVSLGVDSRYTGVLCGLSAIGGATFVAAIAWFSRHT
jgi:hypothetical protein